MTNELWSTPPQFASGQYYSAAMHGNALVNNVDMLFGVYKAPRCCWQTGKMAAGGADYWDEGYGPATNGYRIWVGAVRHKTSGDTLAWCVRVWKNSTQTQTVTVSTIHGSDDDTAAAGSGYVDLTGTIDVSGLDADTFYEVFVDIDSAGQPSAQVLYLYETDAQSYSALAAFTAGTTPSAAQWSALSTRATTLWQQLTEPPTPLFGCFHSHQTPRRGEYGIGRWMFRYRDAYLAYQFRVREPGNNDMSYHCVLTVHGTEKVRKGFYRVLGGGLDESETTIGFAAGSEGLAINDILRRMYGHELIKLTAKLGTGEWTIERGVNGTTPQVLKGRMHVWQPETDGKTWERDKDYVLYRGVVNISDIGLIEGSLYEITATEESFDSDWESPSNKVDSSAFGIDYLYTVSGATPLNAGWYAMPTFGRGTTVGGAGSMKTIRENLTWLSDSKRIVYRNEAAPLLSRWGGYGVRQRRWLVYYCTETEAQPEIVYWRSNGEPEVVGLSNKPYEWVSYDLDSAEGLWDGVGYHVRGVTYAMEDDASV